MPGRGLGPQSPSSVHIVPLPWTSLASLTNLVPALTGSTNDLSSIPLYQASSRSWADGTQSNQQHRVVGPGATPCLSPSVALGEPEQPEQSHADKPLPGAWALRPVGDFEVMVQLWCHPAPALLRFEMSGVTVCSELNQSLSNQTE